MTRKTQRGRARSRPRQPPKFSIAIIGAGRVGFALGRALKNSGHSINVALTKTANPTRIARDLHTSAIAVGAKPLAELPQRYRELIQQSDVLIVATPDDLISQVANDLARLFQTSRFRGPKAVMHTSGALASDVMAAIRQREIAIGSIHPLISISDQTKRKQSFAGVQFSLEGDAAAIRIGKRLVRDLGGDSFVIETAKKPLYHATALMASPNATALFDVAIEMMRQCGMSSARARQILLPLIESTVDNLTHQAPRNALTGTFKRGDIDTMRIHLNAIAAERLTDALKLYVALAKRSLQLANLPKRTTDAMNYILDDAASRFPGD